MDNNASIFGIQFNVNPNALNEHFEKAIEYDDIWESKKTFVHDEDEDLKFSYKYGIKWETFSDGTTNTDNSWYTLYLIPTPESCCEKTVNEVLRHTDYECNVPDMIYFEYGVIMGQHSVENTNVCDEEILNLIANVYESIDKMKDSYLDKPANKLGSTGWDYLREYINGVDAVVTAIERLNQALHL